MKKMKKGFWAGLVAFIIARASHLLITLLIGLQVGLMYPDGLTDGAWNFVTFIDSPVVGLAYLIPATIFIYKKITICQKK